MRRVLAILGVVVLVAVVAVALLLHWAHQQGAARQEAFFQAVLSGEPRRVLDLLHPALRAEVDEPVLAVWMAAVRQHLGAYTGLSGSDFSTRNRTENGVSTLESRGRVEFEKGTADSLLRYQDDEIVAFMVESDALPKPWLVEMPDTSIYDRRARDFLLRLLAGDAAGSLALMDPSLQARYEPQALADALVALKSRLGDVGAIETMEATFQATPVPEVRLRYAVDGEKEDVTARVRFAIEKMHGRLVDFQIPEE